MESHVKQVTFEFKDMSEIAPPKDKLLLLWSPTYGYVGEGFFTGWLKNIPDGKDSRRGHRRFVTETGGGVWDPDDVMWCVPDYMVLTGIRDGEIEHA